jgi:hypothetical protein
LTWCKCNIIQEKHNLVCSETFELLIISEDITRSSAINKHSGQRRIAKNAFGRGVGSKWSELHHSSCGVTFKRVLPDDEQLSSKLVKVK